MTILIIFASILVIKSIPYCKEILYLNKIGDTFKSSDFIYKNKNYDYIIQNKYNTIIDKKINDDYIDIYYQIKYKNIDNYIVNINSLINKGYLVSGATVSTTCIVGD